jgi:death-on-curing protein
VFYLTFDDVLELYVEHVGPRQALNRPDLLESAVALPQATMFGEELYPHVFTKAAAMLRSIAQNQSFIDGNKRIAWIATRVFLAANGLDLLATVDEGLQLMLDLAQKQD